MGALRQPRLSEPSRKPPAKATASPKDQYGRDPNSAPERLRALTDYKADTGYAPAYHAWMADIPRLCGSSAVARDLISIANMLSLGRPRDPKEPRHRATLPLSAAEWAEYCCCDVKQIQRLMVEFPERGIASVKVIKEKGGFVKYVVSLLYENWRELEDYKVWDARRRVVPIDKSEETVEEDDSPAEISKDAVHLTKGRVTVKPGRAVKAKKITTGVNSYKVQSRNERVAVDYEAVIQSGCFVITLGSEEGESQAKVEKSHSTPMSNASPSNGGSALKRNKGESHPRSSEVVNLFDPLLQKSGSRLLSPDETALQAACGELGSVPHDALVYFVLGPKGRGARPISGPRAVASIIREARRNWELSNQAVAEQPAGRRCECGGEFGTIHNGVVMCWKCIGELQDADS